MGLKLLIVGIVLTFGSPTLLAEGVVSSGYEQVLLESDHLLERVLVLIEEGQNTPRSVWQNKHWHFVQSIAEKIPSFRYVMSVRSAAIKELRRLGHRYQRGSADTIFLEMFEAHPNFEESTLKNLKSMVGTTHKILNLLRHREIEWAQSFSLPRNSHLRQMGDRTPTLGQMIDSSSLPIWLQHGDPWFFIPGQQVGSDCTVWLHPGS